MIFRRFDGTSPTRRMWSGVYVGSADSLKGETALLREDVAHGLVLAQFDKHDIEMLSHGWHRFNATDFLVMA